MLRLHLYLQLPLLHGFLLKHIIHVEIIQQHGVLNRCVRCERPVILNPAVVMDPTMKGHPKLVGAEPVSSSKETMVIVTSYEKTKKNVLDWSQPKNCRGLLMHLPSRASKKHIIQSASRARSPQTPLTEFRQILMRETYDIHLGVSINGDTPKWINYNGIAN